MILQTDNVVEVPKGYTAKAVNYRLLAKELSMNLMNHQFSAF